MPVKTKKNKTEELLDTLKEGIRDVFESTKYKEYLKTQSMFHNYSFRNSMLIFLQKPTATYVAGYRKWQKLGRQVQKGEKGIGIIAPIVHKKETETGDPDATKNTTEKKEVKKCCGFRGVSVFDISQTKGKELPLSLTDEIKTNSENSEIVINAIGTISDVPIFFENIEGNSKGYFSPLEEKIVVQDNMSRDQTAKTLIHEYTHSRLHGKDSPAEVGRATAEVQAESVAFIVSDRYGIDTSDYSFGYLASWSSSKELKELEKSLEIIQKTADDIINKVDVALNENLQLHKMKSEQDITNENKVTKHYINEFPPIQFVPESVLQNIDTLNSTEDSILTVDEIKSEYKKLGKKIETENDPAIKEKFKTFETIVNEFRKAELSYREKEFRENSMGMELKKKDIEMIELTK